jgi:hypothetical protein
MNIELLQELRNFFAKVPDEKIEMDIWGRSLNKDGKNEDFSCMTAGCLAGWACVYKPFKEMGLQLKLDAFRGIYQPVYNHPSYGYVYNSNAFSHFFGLPSDIGVCLTDPMCYTDEDKYMIPRAGDLPSYRKIKKSAILQRLDDLINGTWHQSRWYQLHVVGRRAGY